MKRGESAPVTMATLSFSKPCAQIWVLSVLGEAVLDVTPVFMSADCAKSAGELLHAQRCMNGVLRDLRDLQ